MSDEPDRTSPTRPHDPATQLALDDLLKALWLARANHPGADGFGAHLLLALLIEAPAILTHIELGLLIGLFQRIAMRRKWLAAGDDSNQEKL